ncbi:thiamine phosphate synthase [Peptostreptococcaceae bacterium AGR-M142]
MIFFITNSNLVDEKLYFSNIKIALEKNISYLIIREKDKSYKELYEISKKILELKRLVNSKTKILINSNLDILNNLNLDGIHLSNEFYLNNKDKIIKLKDKIIGLSIHNKYELVELPKSIDYLIAGNVFETDCKKGLKGKGVEFFKELKKNTDKKIVAVGGINLNNIKEIKKANLYGYAFMSSFIKNKDLKVFIEDLLYKIEV